MAARVIPFPGVALTDKVLTRRASVSTPCPVCAGGRPLPTLKRLPKALGVKVAELLS